MYAWLTDTFGEQNAMYIAYGGGAIIALLLLWVLWFWTRRVSGGIFVHGGRGRQPRLAVVDATAIDSHRRIVLVRRDNVEHLVMIGGHNDFVIERDIGKAAPATAEKIEPAIPAERPKQAEPVHEAVASPPPPPPAPPREKRPPAPVTAEPRPAAPIMPEPRAEAPLMAEPRPAAPIMPEPRPAAPLMAEPRAAPPPRPPQPPQPPRDVAPPPRPAPIAQAEPPRSELPLAYAELEPAPVRTPAEPRAASESTVRTPSFEAEVEENLEDFIIADEPARVAEPAPSVQAAPTDASLEDEMQKLLAELTRKK